MTELHDHARVMMDLIQFALDDFLGEQWSVEPDLDLVSIDRGGMMAALRLKTADGTIVLIEASVEP